MTNAGHPISIAGVGVSEHCDGHDDSDLCGSEEDDEDHFLREQHVRQLERRVAVLEMENTVMRECFTKLREAAVTMVPAVWMSHGLEQVRDLIANPQSMQKEVERRLAARESAA